MNPTQIALIQSSFAKVAPISDLAADLFYDRLFTLDPTLPHLFKGDLREQKRKLMTMLALAVNSLQRMEKLQATLRELGRRHQSYGTEPQHYDTVVAALLWTLEQGLGAEFTAEVKSAWVALYTRLAAIMQEGARHHDEQSELELAV
ncbi:MAG TPA: globin family protein [Caldilineaceae bacterium]|nr:globin family protein [Caldilineaceae bacterium]